MKNLISTERNTIYFYDDNTVVTKNRTIIEGENAYDTKSVQRDNLTRGKVSDMLLVKKQTIVKREYDNGDIVTTSKTYSYTDGKTPKVIEDSTITFSLE